MRQIRPTLLDLAREWLRFKPHELHDGTSINEMTNLPCVDEMIRTHLAPEVPPELLRYTCGIESMDEFVKSGAEVFAMLDLAARRYGGHALPAFSSILDFGCGNGRLLRFFDAAAQNVQGCDVNQEVIQYVRAHFPHVPCYRNNLMPPLNYNDGRFDLIYSFSVFSHLSQSVEKVWLEELARVGGPGCLYLLSVHGDWMIEATLGDQAAAAMAAGFIWNKVHHRHGVSMDFPIYYEASYHTSSYIRREWAKYFDILDVIKGDDSRRYAFQSQQDHEMIDAVSKIRPMGQDLVIARKRR